MRSIDNPSRTVSQEIPEPLITKTSLEISALNFHWNLSGPMSGVSHPSLVLTRRICPQITDDGADPRFEPSQWETALLCNDVSHWLGANQPWIISLGCGHVPCNLSLPRGILVWHQYVIYRTPGSGAHWWSLPGPVTRFPISVRISWKSP